MYGFRKAFAGIYSRSYFQSTDSGEWRSCQSRALRPALSEYGSIDRIPYSPPGRRDRLCSVTGLNNRLSADRKYYPFGHLARYIGVSSPSYELLTAGHFSTWSIIPKQPLSCKKGEKQPELMPATVMRCGWDRRKKIGRYGKKKSKKANNQRVKAKSKKYLKKNTLSFLFF